MKSWGHCQGEVITGRYRGFILSLVKLCLVQFPSLVGLIGNSKKHFKNIQGERCKAEACRVFEKQLLI